MRTIRLFLIALALAATSACAVDEGPVTGRAALVTSPEQPVRLLHAEMDFACDYDNTGACNSPRYRVTAVVEVQNLAYDKAVALFGTWAYHTGAWDNLAFGQYVGPAGDGAEYWRVTSDWHAGTLWGQSATFSVRYDVAGHSYWDNNDSADYCLGRNRSPCNQQVLGASNVALTETFPTVSRFAGRVQVKNLAYDKVVRVVYTTDDWATVNDTYASYNYSQGYDTEFWTFDSEMSETARQVEFAIEYQVDGQSYWDNNARQNYRVDIPAPASP